MACEIDIKRNAQKQLAKISSPFSEAIVIKILALKTNPGHPVAKSLREKMPGG